MFTIEKEIMTNDDIYIAMKCTEKLATEQRYPFSMIMKLELVTEEACTNALEYGQKNGLSSFYIEWRIASNTFEILVKQKGKKFPLIQSHADNTGLRGRGMTLILNIMDEVEVREEAGFVELYMKKVKEI